MKFKNGDIIRVAPFVFDDGKRYTHVAISLPPSDDGVYTPDTMYLVDAMPCDSKGNNTPEGYETPAPFGTSHFYRVVGNIRDHE